MVEPARMWRLPLFLLAASAWAQQPGSLSFPTYLEGLEALAEGDYAAAEAHFTDCIAQDVANARYHVARAVARALSKQPAEAQTDIDEARRIQAEDAEASTWDWTIGTMANRAWKDLPPPPKDAYEKFLREMAAEYAKGGEARAAATALFPDVAAWFVHRAKSDKRLGPLLLARAAQQYDEKQYDKALYNLEHLLAHQPDDVNLLLHRANCLYALGDWEGARIGFTTVIGKDAARGQAFARRAVAEAHIGNRWRAESDFEIAVALAPEEAESVRHEFDQAVDPLLRAPTPGDVAVCLLEVTQEAVSNSPDLAGIAKGARLMHQVSAGAFPTPDEDDEQRLELLTELGEQGRIDARRARTLVDSHGSDPGFGGSPRPSFAPCMTEVREHMRARAWDKARESLARAAMTDPSNPLLHALWARVESEAGRFAESLIRARVALGLEEARVRLCGAELSGDKFDPLRPVDAALALHMHVHLSSSFDALGQPKEARAHIQSALRIGARVRRWDRSAEVETTDGPCKFEALLEWVRETEQGMEREDE